MKKGISVTLEKEVINYLDKMAKKEERSRSEILNRILKELIVRRLKRNDE